MDWTQLITFFATFLGMQYGQKYLQNRHVRALAKHILETPNDTTDIKDAVRQAVVLAHYRQWSPQVDALAKQHELGKLRIRAAEAAAKKAAKGIDATIVPRDGTEEFKPAFPGLAKGPPK